MVHYELPQIHVTVSLYKLAVKAQHWNWTQECNAAFDMFKKCLISSPVLAYLNLMHTSVLDVDLIHHLYKKNLILHIIVLWYFFINEIIF